MFNILVDYINIDVSKLESFYGEIIWHVVSVVLVVPYLITRGDIYIYIYIYILIYAYIYIDICTYITVHACMHVFVCVYVCVCVCVLSKSNYIRCVHFRSDGNK